MTHFILQARDLRDNEVQTNKPAQISELYWYLDFYTKRRNDYQIIAVFKIIRKPKKAK